MSTRVIPKPDVLGIVPFEDAVMIPELDGHPRESDLWQIFLVNSI